MILEHPTWLRELDIALPANPQVLVTGNLRDIVLIPRGGTAAPRQASVVDAILLELEAAGHRNVIVYDPVDGADAARDDGEVASGLIATVARGQADGATGPELLAALMRAVVTSERPCVLILANASRLAPAGNFSGDGIHGLLATAEKLMLTAQAHPVPGRHRAPLYNTVIWLLDREGDLPYWLASSELARVISVPQPTMEHRVALARSLVLSLPQPPEPNTPELADIVDRFAARTDGLTLRSMTEISRLAQDCQIAADDIGDAVRTFRHGVPDNPWQSADLRRRIRDGATSLGTKVLGQPAAIRKAVDILIRSCMGLTGAESRSSTTRPQGVLFFAGPTGVGKTELAKSIAELVFGQKDSFVRFDMSEFRADHNEARLIGAPPGYEGFSGGGELTNAIRQQPFRLILFDEIEKAHPRILDKFLQILDDGRLTDGTGATVFFSEALIVFTSNLGVYGHDDAGNRIPVVDPGAPYEEVERKIRTAVQEHFKTEIGRPEILNRIGDNIVVFDFICADVAEQLVPMFTGNVIDRIRDDLGIDVTVSDDVRRTLVDEALVQLEFGGRGVRNAVESTFTNPLARALFELDAGTTAATVTRLKRSGDGWTAVLA
ncbi:AAA family ATPase [Mycobacterium bourgelatii]|uniref:AAA family ATPase n=1 Tax=Mycobacterium bourgelatii TaxID=1273442 RepID=UPI00196310F2|nr:AAA family ATPase [Mycobacterium bourgelatii]MCV6973473.1 ATP-dependent Clp protease ATP-binding subunit [Mycobacterium bourgelatii]